MFGRVGTEVNGNISVTLQTKDFDALQGNNSKVYKPPKNWLGRLFRRGSKSVYRCISEQSCQRLLGTSQARLEELNKMHGLVRFFKRGEISQHKRIIKVCTDALQPGGKQTVSSKQPEVPVEETGSVNPLEQSFEVKKKTLIDLLSVGEGGFHGLSQERKTELRDTITFAKEVIASPEDYPGLTVKGVKESAARAQKMLDLSIVSRSKEIAENVRKLNYNDSSFITDVDKLFDELEFMADAMGNFDLWDKIQGSRREFSEFYVQSIGGVSGEDDDVVFS